jgi:hypothetical protein
MYISWELGTQIYYALRHVLFLDKRREGKETDRHNILDTIVTGIRETSTDFYFPIV